MLPFSEFLETTKVIRMLYGAKSARDYFEENIEKYTAIIELDLTRLKSYLHL